MLLGGLSVNLNHLKSEDEMDLFLGLELNDFQSPMTSYVERGAAKYSDVSEDEFEPNKRDGGQKNR